MLSHTIWCSMVPSCDFFTIKTLYLTFGSISVIYCIRNLNSNSNQLSLVLVHRQTRKMLKYNEFLNMNLRLPTVLFTAPAFMIGYVLQGVKF